MTKTLSSDRDHARLATAGGAAESASAAARQGTQALDIEFVKVWLSASAARQSQNWPGSGRDLRIDRCSHMSGPVRDEAPQGQIAGIQRPQASN